MDRRIKENKKIELVSPAGSWDHLIAAINGGADAVYMGYSKFNARVYAENFNFSLLKKAVHTAHDSGVKVYLTLNTLIKDSEIKEVIQFLNEYLSFCRDGIIIQDFGLLQSIKDLLLKEAPDLRVHASTQMNTHNLKSAEFLKEIDFKRIILAREMTLEEIRNITGKELTEIEIFAHGSCCYCYSGSCYFSSFTGARSGNRGRCTQPCRMKYKFEKNGRLTGRDLFFLSKTDLCTLELIPQIISAGVDALKIEGRMKTPDYVGIITKVYRKYIDLFYSNQDSYPEGKNYQIDKNDYYKITQVFSRDLSSGYLLNEYPPDIISVKKSGSVGNFLGRISNIEFENADNKKRRYPAAVNLKSFRGKKADNTGRNPDFKKNLKVKAIYMKSAREIKMGDVLEIWTSRGNEQLKVEKAELIKKERDKFSYKIMTGSDIRLKINDRVFKVFDINLDKEAKNLYKKGIIKNNIIMNNRSISNDKTNASTLIKNTPDMLVDELIISSYFNDAITRRKEKITDNGDFKKKPTISVEIYDCSVLKDILNLGADYIIVNDSKFIKNTGRDYMCNIPVSDKNSTGSIFIKTPRIVYDVNMLEIEDFIIKAIKAGFNNFSVSNPGVLKSIIDISNNERFTDKNIYIRRINILLDYTFNIFNGKAVEFFFKYIKKTSASGIKKDPENLAAENPAVDLIYAVISPELALDEIRTINEGFPALKLGVYSFGFFPVMISRINLKFLNQTEKFFPGPIKTVNGKKNRTVSEDEIMQGGFQNCSLVDQKGYKFRIDTDSNKNLIFLNSKKICNFFDMEDFFINNVTDFYLDTRTLKLNEIIQLVKFYKKASRLLERKDLLKFRDLTGEAEGTGLFQNYTKGHFYRKVL